MPCCTKSATRCCARHTPHFAAAPGAGVRYPYSDDWYRFTFLSDAWLPDYCLYMAIKEENKMCDWQTWPAPLRLRDPKALEEFRTGHADELGFWRCAV